MTGWLTKNRTLLVALAAPLALVALFYLFVVRPRVATARRAAEETVAIRTRLRAVPRDSNPSSWGPASAGPALSWGPTGVVPAKAGPHDDAAIQEFEQRVPAADRVPDLVERLARVALGSAPAQEIRRLKIETGERVDAVAPDAARGPRVASDGLAMPDPRLALFGAPVGYTTIALSFDATYPALGRFLWNLRDLPTTIEIRSLDVSRPASATAGGLLRVEMSLFAFRRAGSKAS